MYKGSVRFVVVASVSPPSHTRRFAPAFGFSAPPALAHHQQRVVSTLTAGALFGNVFLARSTGDVTQHVRRLILGPLGSARAKPFVLPRVDGLNSHDAQHHGERYPFNRRSVLSSST